MLTQQQKTLKTEGIWAGQWQHEAYKAAAVCKTSAGDPQYRGVQWHVCEMATEWRDAVTPENNILGSDAAVSSAH
jgi:hypothetical protein